MPNPTQFPDTLDTQALALIYEKWKNPETVLDKATFGLSAWNVAGFFLGQTIGQPPLPMGATDDISIDASFQAALQPPVTGYAKIDLANLAKVLLPIILKIIVGL